jgi:hypothetical protein
MIGGYNPIFFISFSLQTVALQNRMSNNDTYKTDIIPLHPQKKTNDITSTSEIIFNNEPHIATMFTLNNNILVIEIEHKKSGERWRGEYSEQSMISII